MEAKLQRERLKIGGRVTFVDEAMRLSRRASPGLVYVQRVRCNVMQDEKSRDAHQRVLNILKACNTPSTPSSNMPVSPKFASFLSRNASKAESFANTTTFDTLRPPPSRPSSAFRASHLRPSSAGRTGKRPHSAPSARSQTPLGGKGKLMQQLRAACLEATDFLQDDGKATITDATVRKARMPAARPPVGSGGAGDDFGSGDAGDHVGRRRWGSHSSRDVLNRQDAHICTNENVETSSPAGKAQGLKARVTRVRLHLGHEDRLAPTRAVVRHQDSNGEPWKRDSKRMRVRPQGPSGSGRQAQRHRLSASVSPSGQAYLLDAGAQSPRRLLPRISESPPSGKKRSRADRRSVSPQKRVGQLSPDTGLTMGALQVE